MTPNSIKEHLSRNQFKTIANRCGYKCEGPADGDNGVDFRVCAVTEVIYPQGPRFIDDGKILQYQLKSTTMAGVDFIDGVVKYDLEAKTYNDLIYRLQGNYPLTLILAVLPEAEINWVICNEQNLCQETQLYWYRPSAGDTLTHNAATKRISVPIDNRVDLNFLPNQFAEMFA